jgi:hypothetical protein
MQMIGSALIGADEIVAKWVSEKIVGCNGFGPCTAIGVVRDGKLSGGVVYHEFRKHDVRVSIALDGAGFSVPWRLLFSYPFNELKCVRITSMIDKRNKRSRALCERLGFKMEGVHPKGVDGWATAVSYGMLKENCRWIKHNGQS